MSRAYSAWINMKTRCFDKNYRSYSDYGGRGITVCEKWLSFESFLSDIGQPPEGMTLDRRNNDGNYEPSNCRWVSRNVQQRNKRGSKGSTSKFKGVSWNNRDKVWIVQLKVNKKSIYIGSYSDEEDAAQAYDSAASQYFGADALLNFKKEHSK